MADDGSIEHRAVKGGGGWGIIRRAAHLILSLGIAYYILPENLLTNVIPRWFLLIAAVIIVLTVELSRLKKKRVFPGMRDYEESGIGSYVYAVIGMAIVLFIAPAEIGVPCILGMAWSDPVAGELRRSGRPEWIIRISCALTYFLIAIASVVIMQPFFIVNISLFIILMTFLAVIWEGKRIRYLDDDFTMLVVPGIAGTLLFWTLS